MIRRFCEHMRPRLADFRCRILENEKFGWFVWVGHDSCCMSHASPTGEWYTHSSLLSESNSLRKKRGRQIHLFIKSVKYVYKLSTNLIDTLLHRLAEVILTLWVFDVVSFCSEWIISVRNIFARSFQTNLNQTRRCEFSNWENEILIKWF